MSEMANTKERSGELARIAIAALEEKKATDIRVIDISEVSVRLFHYRKRFKPSPDPGFV